MCGPRTCFTVYGLRRVPHFLRPASPSESPLLGGGMLLGSPTITDAGLSPTGQAQLGSDGVDAPASAESEPSRRTMSSDIRHAATEPVASSRRRTSATDHSGRSLLSPPCCTMRQRHSARTGQSKSNRGFDVLRRDARPSPNRLSAKSAEIWRQQKLHEFRNRSDEAVAAQIVEHRGHRRWRVF